MIYGIYAIRDLKTGYMSLNISRNDEDAKRGFIHAVKQTGTLINANYQDFDLMYLGSYDADNGIIYPCEEEHILILSGSSIFLGDEKVGEN